MHIPTLPTTLLLLTLTSLTSASTTTITEWRGRKFNMSPTLVEYSSTATTTAYHDCGTHEALAVVTRRFGHGPIRVVTTTFTAPVTYSTKHVCSGLII